MTVQELIDELNALRRTGLNATVEIELGDEVADILRIVHDTERKVVTVYLK